MKRVLCFFNIILFSLLSYGQRGQDFASHFMEECKEDTAIHCITVSPHMMGQMLKTHSANQNEEINNIISKLKSVRIISASRQCEDYYQMAERILEKNKNRFQRDESYRSGHAYGCFYIRKRNDEIVELVMLYANVHSEKFIIINLTGTIDTESIESLTKIWEGKTAKLR